MVIKVEAHPYNLDVYLHIDREAMARYCVRTEHAREELLDYIDGAAGYCDWNLPKAGVHIGVFDGDTSTLVHELVHAAQYILKRAGIDPLHAEAEPLAYLVDDLYRRLIPKFNAAVAASKEK